MPVNSPAPRATPRSIKSFILVVAAAVSLVGFVGMFLILSSTHDRLLREDARATSETIARQSFNSMFEVMRKGWSRTDMEAFLHAQKDAFTGSPYAIEVYRGEKVEALFGPIPEQKLIPDEAVRRGFATAEAAQIEEGERLRYVFPLKARGECLSCHVNAREGDVLGVIDVEQNLAPLTAKARQDFFYNLLLIAPIPFLAALLLAIFLNRTLQRAIETLRGRVEQVNKVSDLRHLSLAQTQVGFRELQTLLDSVDEMVSRLRGFAVDKDLLEFEIRLLERFVMTSDVVRDWREYVERLLLEINHVVHAYTLFSVFKVDDELFDLEIFWNAPPSEKTRALLDSAARKALSALPMMEDPEKLTVHHHIADPTAETIDLDEHQIEVATKSLVVTSPKIGGIVGIGVQADISRDEVRQLVLESILSTLLNVVGSVKAISKYTKDLEYYASRDPLTNLYNRRVFWELLEYEQARAERHHYPFGLLVIDLDNFKAVNDRYGHQMGDRFLQAVAETLQKGLRKGDVFARYGGDEFVVMLPELSSAEEPYQIAQGLLERVSDITLLTPDGSQVKATISIGVAIYPEHANNPRDLFLFADNMMYRAKSEGKNRLSQPTEQDVIENFHQVNETIELVTRAIEERWLQPFFQPIVSTRDGRAHAHEVLSRIALPDGQFINAAAFIETVEQLGLIHRMDEIVMEKALDHASRSGYEGLLFLNISPRSLVLNEFFPTVKRLAQKYAIAPSRMVFELTERETVKTPAMLERFVGRLHMEGFKFAIDDFGSGFSSFHYIKKFPIDYIKLEGDFVLNMMNDPRDLAMVRNIAALARELDILTIAEYVESDEVMKKVASLGVDYAQGYHVGRPAPGLRLS